MSVVPPEEFLKYTNEARTNPAKFAQYVKDQLETFIDENTMPLKPGCNRSTFEGKAAWREAIDFLMKQKPIHPLKLNQGLCLACQDHTADMIKTGVTSHNSSDGSSFSDRIHRRCGKAYGSSGENISRDFLVEGRKHGLTSVMKLIIDDGTSSRGHRKNIFNEKFNYVGTDTKVINGKVITVQDFHENNVGVDNNGEGNATNIKANNSVPKNTGSNSSMKKDDILTKAVNQKKQVPSNKPTTVPSAEQTLRYLNEARTNPTQFAKYVQNEMNTFIDERTLPLKPGCNQSTNEGKSSWREAYNFLLNQKPLQPLKLHKGLCQAAEDHAIDMAKTGLFQHDSSDGKSFSARIQKRCGKSYGMSGQNLGCDFIVEGRNTALQTTLQLIIDDGVPSRGHRNNIFNEKFNYVGIDSKIQKGKIITVQDFHSNIGDNKNGGTSLGVPVSTTNNNSTFSNAGSRILNNEQSTPIKAASQPKPRVNEVPSNKSRNIFEPLVKEDNKSNKKFHMNQWGNMDSIETELKKMGFNNANNNGFGTKSPNYGQMKNQGGSGDRKVVSTSTHTKTRISNGVKTITVTTKLKYSDGSTQENIQQTTETA